MIFYNIFITFTFLLRSICCPNLLCVKGRITFVSRIAVLFKHPIPAYKHNTAIPASLSTNQLPINTKPETSPLLQETKPRQSWRVFGCQKVFRHLAGKSYVSKHFHLYVVALLPALAWLLCEGRVSMQSVRLPNSHLFVIHQLRNKPYSNPSGV